MTAGGPSAGPGSKHPVKIFANIFISFIGAGVLGLPFAFKEAGILEGTVVMALVGTLSVRAMLLLIHCKYRILEKHKPPPRKVVTEDSAGDGLQGTGTGETDGLKEWEEKTVVDFEMEQNVKQNKTGQPMDMDLSYGDVGYHAIGHTGRLLVDLAIVISQTGFCCAYLIFISENLSDYFPSMKLIHWLFILLPPLCILTLARQLGALALTSLLAQFSNLMAFAVVFWFDFDHLHNIEVHPKKMKLEGLPFFLAISIYCYEGAGMILSLESSIVEEKRHKFKRYFITTMVIVTTLYITFGGCGYASFGKDTNPIITLNLPKGESIDFAMVVKSCLCIALFFTFPVMMFPVMKIMDGYLIYKPDSSLWKGNVLRITMVMMTGVVVMSIPSFANLMALVGATCCTLLAFILPGLFHMSIFKGSLSRNQLIFDWFLIGLGIVGAIIGILDAVNRLIEAGDDHDMVAKNLPTPMNVHNSTATTLAATTPGV